MADREPCIVDASVFVDIAVRSVGWEQSAQALRGRALHAPAHVDVEVMSAIARLSRGGMLAPEQATHALDRFRAAPIQRHALPDLVRGAWSRSASLPVADALYVELAVTLGRPLLTADARLARSHEVAVLIG